jgi:hypothetical protein
MNENNINEYLGDIIINAYSIIDEIDEKEIKNLLDKKNQIKLNEIINKIITTIDISEIKTKIYNNDNLNIIVNIFKKYILLTIFIIIGLFYNDENKFKQDLLIYFQNNNQELYNANILALINKYTKMCNNVINEIKKQTGGKIEKKNSKKIKKDKEIKKKDKEIKEKDKEIKEKDKEIKEKDKEINEKNKEINEKDKEIKEKDKEIEEEIKIHKNKIYNVDITELKNIYNSTDPYKDKLFMIIRLIILINEYIVVEKKDIIKILNNELFENSESMYIDVIYSNTTYLDILNIESLFTPVENLQGLSKLIFNLINSEKSKSLEFKNIDEDILNLMKSNIIIPISEEFLLYHREDEKYDKSIDKSNISKFKFKKENQTKFDYIIGKINNAEKVYDIDFDKNIKNNIFYKPLENKDAVIINEYENIKLINKMEQQKGNESILNNLNILYNYDQNAYINYNNFKNYGFNIILNNSINLLRSVSLNEKNLNQYQNIQFRTGGNAQNVNIIGFALLNDNLPLQCLKCNQINKNRVTYNEFITNIYKKITKNSFDNCYWIFDIEKDNYILKSYTNITQKQNNQYNCKLLANNLYKDILKIINNKILFEINKQNKLTLNIANNIIDNIKIDKTDVDIQKIIYEKISHEINIFDKNENILFGFDENKIDLKEVDIGDKMNLINVIDVTTENINIINEGKKINKINSICQHFIELDDIDYKHKIKGINYNNLIFNFSLKYIKENSNGDFICKSCGEKLDIDKYIQDGKFDDNNRFIAFGSIIESNLEDYVEYKKFIGIDGVIKGVDRLINKISGLIGLSYLFGNNVKQRIARKGIVKNVIDLIIENNEILDKRNYTERNIEANNLYNINRNMSDLYKFNLDNSVFKNVSNDKDFYKFIKINNIIIYCIILIIVELDQSQIMDITQNKYCGYEEFKKYNGKIFNNLKLRMNDNIIKPILDYPVLCFIIYIFSCSISKYNIYYIPEEYKNKLNKKIQINPYCQIKIIQTTIDLLNSIIENNEYIKNLFNTGKSKNVKSLTYQLYKIFTIKYASKINLLYKKHEIFDTLANNNKINIILDKFDKTNNIIGNYEEYKYKNTKNIIEYQNLKNITIRNSENIINTINFSNVKYTYKNVCKNGKIHEWKFIKNKGLICLNCNINYNDILKQDEKDIDKVNEEIFSNVELNLLEDLGNRYCINGIPHLWKLNFKLNIQTCLICGYIKGDHIPIDKLLELKKNFFKTQIIPNNISEVIDIKNVYDKLENNYKKDNKIDNIINKFIKIIKDKFGNIININNKEINFDFDKYKFSHNNLGYDVKPEIIIYENEIKFKKNHEFFNCNVYYYILTDKKIEIYYNQNTNILLGYREFNKNYIKTINKNNYRAEIDYSFKNQIKNMLLKSMNFYINNNDDLTNLLFEFYNNSVNFVYKLLINLNMIKTNKIIPPILENKFDNNDNDINSNIFKIDKYYKKLENIKYENTFKNCNNILNRIRININLHQNINNTLITSDEIYNNEQCNVLLFYIITELINLIEENDNKNSIIEFVIEYINYIFTENNKNTFLQNPIIIKYINVLNSSDYYNDLKQYYGYENLEKMDIEKDIKNKNIDNDDFDDEDDQEGYDLNDLDNEDNENLDNEGENIDNINIDRNESIWNLGYENNLD